PKPGVICGVKFHDVNGNGIQDSGEPGLPGWTINMLDSAGNTVATVQSERSGRFCFEGVKPGTYTFAEVMKPNWVQTAPVAPGTYTVTVMAGINLQVLAFGNRAKADPCCLTFRFPAGRADGFATGDGLETATPSSALTAVLSGTLSTIFDGTVMNRHFGHTFTLPQGNCIRSARLDIMARPLGAGNTVANDTVSLRFAGVAGSPTWGAYFGPGNPNPGLLANPWKLPNYGGGQLISLDLSNLPGSVNLISTLQAQRFLDVAIQDDTAVDYMVLHVEFCECTTKPDHSTK
ncbi:MAG TPA: SdrD B-like domain-containing protein, partial [Symbiobacteriaceae bacterium]|nr:SdrD B-like domain-containing protein [Symbiobacteriaceae bacterium]